MSEEIIHEPTINLLLEYIKKHHKLQIYLDLNEFDNFVNEKFKKNKVKTSKIIVKKPCIIKKPCVIKKKPGVIKKKPRIVIKKKEVVESNKPEKIFKKKKINKKKKNYDRL